MDRNKKIPVTELNEYDKKILQKHTRHYTNFIESSTAKNDIIKNKAYNGYNEKQ